MSPNGKAPRYCRSEQLLNLFLLLRSCEEKILVNIDEGAGYYASPGITGITGRDYPLNITNGSDRFGGKVVLPYSIVIDTIAGELLNLEGINSSAWLGIVREISG